MKLNVKWIVFALFVIAVLITIPYFGWSFNSENTPPTAVTNAETKMTVEISPEPPVDTPQLDAGPVSPISPVSPIEPKNLIATPSPEELQTMVNMAIAAQDQGDYQRAIELANSLLAENPNDFIALNIRGSAYLSNEDTDQAIKDYSAAIELEPFFPHAYYNRGRVYRMQADYDKALEDLQKSIDLAPLEFGYKANGNIGLIYFAQGQYEDSLQALSKSIELNMEDKADVYYFRGNTNVVLGNYEAAITDYQAAVERFPNFSRAYRGMAFAKYKMGQFDGAGDDLAKSEAISPNHPTGLMYQALVLLSTGQAEQGVDLAEKGIAAINNLSTEEKANLINQITDELNILVDTFPDSEEQIQSIREKLNAQD